MRFWVSALIGRLLPRGRRRRHPGVNPCGDRYAAVFPGALDRSEYTLAIETPGMYLAYRTKEGSNFSRLECLDKTTGKSLGWVGMSVKSPGDTWGAPLFPKDWQNRRVAHLPIYIDEPLDADSVQRRNMPQ